MTKQRSLSLYDGQWLTRARSSSTIRVFALLVVFVMTYRQGSLFIPLMQDNELRQQRHATLLLPPIEENEWNQLLLRPIQENAWNQSESNSNHSTQNNINFKSNSNHANLKMITNYLKMITNYKSNSNHTNFKKMITRSKSKSNHTRPMMYARLRRDRSGASIIDMLSAHAFAFAKNMSYGGACPVDPNIETYKHLEEQIRLIQSLGLEDELPLACPKNRNEIFHFKKYRYAEFSPAWLDYMRSRIQYREDHLNSKDIKQVSVHVRRGDVGPCQYSDRYLPNSYYLEVLESMGALNTNNDSNSTTKYNITIHSESNSFESWRDFETAFKNITTTQLNLDLDSDLVSTWNAMVNADVLVASRSAFSFATAILSRGTVLFPFNKTLHHYEVVDRRIGDEATEEKKRLQRKLLCTKSDY